MSIPGTRYDLFLCERCGGVTGSVSTPTLIGWETRFVCLHCDHPNYAWWENAVQVETPEEHSVAYNAYHDAVAADPVEVVES